MPGRLVLGIGGDRIHQRLGREHVVPHRRVHLVGGIGERLGVGRLLAEGRDPAAVRRGLDHAELVGLFDRGTDRGDGDGRAAIDVLGDHLARVHPVDVIGTEHDDVVGPLIMDQVEVLVDRIGRADEPARPAAHLGRHRGHVVAEQRRQPPGQRDVPVE